MELSVVVPTLNGRERLSGCLDALAARASDAEVVVVNGPSTDGTTGMVCDRDDVDVLLELSERNVNVARNAGVRASTGDVVAFLSDALRPDRGWADAVRDGVAGGADAVTGPVDRQGADPDPFEPGSTSPGDGTDLRGGNAAFARETLAAMDGFDEYLRIGGAIDAAHRLAAGGFTVERVPGMVASHPVETDGGSPVRSGRPRPAPADDSVGWGWKYRSLTYLLVKNYGLRPTVLGRVVRRGLDDALAGVRLVVDDDVTATDWLAGGRTAGSNVLRGLRDGLAARVADRTDSRNPHGLSARTDRPVERYDWR